MAFKQSYFKEHWKTKLRRKATCPCTQSVIVDVLQAILSMAILFVHTLLNLQMELPRVLRGVQLLPTSSSFCATKDDVWCSVPTLMYTATCPCTQSVIVDVLQAILSMAILFVHTLLNLQMELPRVLRGVQLLPTSSSFCATKDDVWCSVPTLMYTFVN